MSDVKSPVILQVIPALSAGGAERTAVEMAEAITLAGGTALVASEGGRMLDELTRAGGMHIPLPAATKNPLRMLANVRTLIQICKEYGVQLIHARSRAPGWSARLAAYQLKLPFVTTYHGVYNQGGKLKSAYNSVMASGNRVIANSHYTASIVSARHKTPEERLTVIHRGVDLKRFDPAKVSADAIAGLRTKWGLEPADRIVLVAARLTRWKGQTTVVDAAARLMRTAALRDTVFIFAGDPQGRDRYVGELERRIATNGLQRSVRIVGHCADMPAAFAAAHLTLVPSIEPEAFGRSSVEAQAMGCPVIVSDTGALRETLEPDTTGWLVPPGDAAALSRQLAESLLLPQPRLAAMREAAARHARAHFSIARMQENTLAVYDELLQTCLTRAFCGK
jgi:glycosyltransferase involved in cell wall biosynthesis